MVPMACDQLPHGIAPQSDIVRNCHMPLWLQGPLSLYLHIALLSGSHRSGGIATGLSSQFCFWSRTAPRPKDEASADFGWCGSNTANTGLQLMLSLVSSNMTLWLIPAPLVGSSQKVSQELVLSVIPKRWWTSTQVGVLSFRIAETLSGSGLTPAWSTICPRNFMYTRLTIGITNCASQAGALVLLFHHVLSIWTIHMKSV